MANKITRKYAASAQGVLYIDEGKLFIEIEDKGTYDLSEFLKDFDGKECKISCAYDEDYTEPEVDEETGEVI